MPELDVPERELQREVEDLARHQSGIVRRNFFLAQLFSWLSIAASFVAAILAASGRVPPAVLAAVAAVPAFAISVDKVFGLAKRACWHYVYRARLHNLRDKLKYEGTAAPDGSRELAELRVSMEQSYPIMDAGAAGRPP